MKKILRSTFGTLVVAAFLVLTPPIYAKGGHAIVGIRLGRKGCTLLFHQPAGHPVKTIPRPVVLVNGRTVGQVRIAMGLIRGGIVNVLKKQ